MVSFASDPELARKTWFRPSGVISLRIAESSITGGVAVWKKVL